MTNSRAAHEPIPDPCIPARPTTAADRLLAGDPARLRLTVMREEARARWAEDRRAFPGPRRDRTSPGVATAVAGSGAAPTATLADAPLHGTPDARPGRSTQAPTPPVDTGARPARPPTVRGLAGPGGWRLLGDLDASLARLAHGAVECATPREGEVTIQRAARENQCSIVEVTRLILEGRLPWTGRLTSEAGFSSILVRSVDVAQNDPICKTRYKALRARGHGHARALRSVADRLLGVACAMLKTGSIFDPGLTAKTAC